METSIYFFFYCRIYMYKYKAGQSVVNGTTDVVKAVKLFGEYFGVTIRMLC